MPAAFYFNSAVGGTQVKFDRLKKKKHYLSAAATCMCYHICGHWQWAAIGSAYGFQASS